MSSFFVNNTSSPTISTDHPLAPFLMSQQQVIDFLEENPRDIPLGGIDRVETWWVQRQEALEHAGYMLRPRYRPGWKPSWEGTDKLYFRCEDGQKEGVRVENSVPLCFCLRI